MLLLPRIFLALKLLKHEMSRLLFAVKLIKKQLVIKKQLEVVTSTTTDKLVV